MHGELFYCKLPELALLIGTQEHVLARIHVSTLVRQPYIEAVVNEPIGYGFAYSFLSDGHPRLRVTAVSVHEQYGWLVLSQLQLIRIEADDAVDFLATFEQPLKSQYGAVSRRGLVREQPVSMRKRHLLDSLRRKVRV